MQMLRDIKAGKPVETCTRAPAIGSYLHKKAEYFHSLKAEWRRDNLTASICSTQSCIKLAELAISYPFAGTQWEEKDFKFFCSEAGLQPSQFAFVWTFWFAGCRRPTQNKPRVGKAGAAGVSLHHWTSFHLSYDCEGSSGMSTESKSIRYIDNRPDCGPFKFFSLMEELSQATKISNHVPKV